MWIRFRLDIYNSLEQIFYLTHRRLWILHLLLIRSSCLWYSPMLYSANQLSQSAATKLGQSMAIFTSQWLEMYCHDLGVMSSNPGRVEIGVLGTSIPNRTWIKIFYCQCCSIAQAYDSGLVFSSYLIYHIRSNMLSLRLYWGHATIVTSNLSNGFWQCHVSSQQLKVYPLVSTTGYVDITSLLCNQELMAFSMPYCQRVCCVL